MTPELMQIWIRECWAKRPAANLFRPPNILGMDIHYSHVDEAVQDVLKTVCNTTTKFVPGGMTSIMAGPDTHWNKVFKGQMREEMDTYMETEEYELTKSGKIAPAPYKRICDWVVAAWDKVKPETVGNAFSHNGWHQAYNQNDTSVLHTTLKDLVERNIVRGFQRRHSPEEVESHNLNLEMAKDGLYSDDDEFEGEPDDFDFYRLQQEEMQLGKTSGKSATLPSDNIDFSDVDESESAEDDDNSQEENSEPERELDGNSDAEDSGDSELYFYHIVSRVVDKFMYNST